MLRLPLSTQLFILMLIPLAATVPAWLSVQRSFALSDQAEAAVATAVNTLGLGHQVAQAADQAIQEERGYLLTGDVIFIEPYEAAVADFNGKVVLLEQLVGKDPIQGERLQELKRAFEEWKGQVAEPAIAARRNNDLSSGASLVATSGRELSRQLHALSGELIRAQYSLVEGATQASRNARQKAAQLGFFIIGGAMALAVVLGGILSYVIRRRLTELSRATAALASGDLSRRVELPGADELSRLAHSFNRMAGALQARTLESVGLRRMSELLQACTTVEEAYDVISRSAGTLFPGQSGVIQLINSSRTILEVVGAFGDRQDGSGEPSAPQDCWAFRRGTPHRVDASGSVPRCKHASTEESTYACLPLSSHGESLGVLTLAPLPSSDGVDLATLMAEQVGLAIGNLRLRDMLRTQAIRDGLTGLYNRRYYEEAAERELARARRQNRSVAFLVLDVDHFKRFNDTFGHDAGDFLLREAGHLLKAGVRASDIACRYGGEEFVLILPESNAVEASKRADTIREAFQSLQLTYREQTLGPITVSIGVAAFPHHGNERDTVLKAADTALYKAKSGGRNRVEIA